MAKTKQAPTLAEQASAIAAAQPREVFHALLRRMLPTRPVATRPPTNVEAWDAAIAAKRAALEARGFGKAERQPGPFAKLAGKRRRVANRSYTILSRVHGARYGTKRARQLEIVLAYTDTRLAMQAGAESIDFTYAEQIGLIKFN
jgi:hypothetical protein